MGADPSTPVSSPTAGTRPRPLWQVPVFLAGFSALVAALATRAPADPGQHQVGRHLARASQLLAHGEAEAAAKEAQEALEIIGPEPNPRAGEAHFLLGSARMRLADRTPGDDGRPHWVAARQALEEAQRRGGLTEEQDRLLRYRLAKVAFHTGDDPRQVADRLAASADGAEDRTEAYDLLCEAYLRLDPPELQKALDANTKLREQALLQNDMLARVKLRSGELKLKLGRAEEARKDLELIGPAAPPPVLGRARLLRARSYQDEGKWAEAAALWQAALADPREPVPDRATALYLLGVCQRHLDQPDQALRAWDECVKAAADGPEGVAAAVQLAELRLERKEYAPALDLLAAAAGRVKDPAKWDNPHLDRDRAVAAFDKAEQAFRDAGQFELALRLADHLERLTPPGRAAAVRAEAATAWARKRKGAAGAAAPPPEEEQAARDLFRRAAAAYAESAAAAAEEARADLLWRAAGRYVEGQDLTQAAPALERFLKAERRADRLGEGWYLLGEVRRQAKDPEGAEAAYLTCIGYPTPFAYRARYQVALLRSQDGRLDKAVEILEQNLSFLRFDPDAEAREQSLFALGNFAYQRHDYKAVALRLEEALGQFPANPEATRARYQLADSYRQLAAQAKRDELIGESSNPQYLEHLSKEHKRWLQKAADEYQELAAFLEKPESAGHLTPEERNEVPFTAAECRYNLGQYAEALALYERLAEANAKTKKTLLLALGGALRCHVALRQDDKVRQRLDEIRAALGGMDESVRREWEEWLSLAMRPAPNDRVTR
jgi:tetratricopeptide (TPR) repeat protein